MNIGFEDFLKLIHYGFAAFYALGIFIYFWSRFVEDKIEWEEAYKQGNPHGEYIGSNIGACVLVHNIWLSIYLQAVPIVFMVFSGLAAVSITMYRNMVPVLEALKKREEEEEKQGFRIDSSGKIVGKENVAVTIPKAIEFIQTYKKNFVGAQAKAPIMSGTESDIEIFKAVIAVENTMADIGGRSEDRLEISEQYGLPDTSLIEKVLPYYANTPEGKLLNSQMYADSDNDHPLTADPRSAFDRPDRN